jgi:hypothetical protein
VPGHTASPWRPFSPDGRAPVTTASDATSTVGRRDGPGGRSPTTAIRARSSPPLHSGWQWIASGGRTDHPRVAGDRPAGRGAAARPHWGRDRGGVRPDGRRLASLSALASHAGTTPCGSGTSTPGHFAAARPHQPLPGGLRSDGRSTSGAGRHQRLWDAATGEPWRPHSPRPRGLGPQPRRPGWRRPRGMPGADLGRGDGPPRKEIQVPAAASS